MLTETIKEIISSISPSELESLYEEYIVTNSCHSEEDFVAHLYRHKHISKAEYKNIQIQEKIDLSTISYTEGFTNIGKRRQNADMDVYKTTCTHTDVGDYTVLESIGEGSMGEILVARDNRLNRNVAYKKIHPHIGNIRNYIGRFYMEAQITAQLQHPNIVPVYGLVESDRNNAGYTMKLINGITLKDHIRETRKQYDAHGKPDKYHTLRIRLEHFLKVCDAMHYAHRKGVIHRDLKPKNIMIGPYNEVYVMDWGIAKTIDVDRETFSDKTVLIDPDEVHDKDKTKMGQAIGTPAYMSPEQAEGDLDILDHRSDLYSLGLILFELVTLLRAINGKDSDEVITKARCGQIDPPSLYAKEADEQKQLLAIVAKATRYLPEDRYATVSDFANDIRHFMYGNAIDAQPESLRQKIMRWISHHRKATLNIMIFSVMLIVVLMLALLLKTTVYD